MAKPVQMTRDEVIAYLKAHHVWKGRVAYEEHAEWSLADIYVNVVFDEGDLQEIDGKLIFDMKARMAGRHLVVQGARPKADTPLLFFGIPQDV